MKGRHEKVAGKSKVSGGEKRELKCSWCGRAQSEVSKLVGGPGVCICNECVGLCNDMLAVEKEFEAKRPPLAVIPARMAATRFPGKPLAMIRGKPMVQHVYDRCIESGAFSEVVIATDSDQIIAAAKKFGARAAMTSESCASGSDRVAQIAHDMKAPYVVNVQGDEPAMHPEILRAVVAALRIPGVGIATAVRPLRDEERTNPNVVKAVVGDNNYALYFSRADVPYPRGPEGKRWAHLGVYGYRSETLTRLATLKPTSIEKTESLEQLRALENGIRIYCAITEHSSVGVDRPEDIPAAEALLKAMGK